MSTTSPTVPPETYAEAPAATPAEGVSARSAAPQGPSDRGSSPRKPFFARRAVRWGAAAVVGILLAGAGFASGFATGAAVSGAGGVGGAGTRGQLGPGQGGFPGGELPQRPDGGQMPMGPGGDGGSGTDSGSGTGNGSGSGSSTDGSTGSGTDSGATS